MRDLGPSTNGFNVIFTVSASIMGGPMERFLNIRTSRKLKCRSGTNRTVPHCTVISPALIRANTRSTSHSGSPKTVT
jgi:hypothetical protein